MMMMPLVGNLKNNTKTEIFVIFCSNTQTRLEKLHLSPTRQSVWCVAACDAYDEAGFQPLSATSMSSWEQQ